MDKSEENIKHAGHDTIKLTLEDDSVVECNILTAFDCNGKEYIALAPVNPETDGDVYLYGFKEYEENEIELINIEDKDEMQAVISAFEEWCDSQDDGMTAVDIYSGFLGAGKTTLIKKMISEAYAGQKVVLIENEFGEINVDSGFLKDSGVQITEMSSGCICCSLVGDFSESLKKVVAEYAPDRIIIEPSGVGKLSDVMNAVEKVAEDAPIYLNSFTAVVDIKKYSKYMKLFGEFFIDQIRSASVVVLSRTQDATDEEIEKCSDVLNEINHDALIVTTPWDDIDGKQILSVLENGADLQFEAEDWDQTELENYADMEDDDEHEHHHHHDHDHECGCHHDHDHDDHDHECGCHHDHDHDDHDHECGCHHDHHGHHADDVFTSCGIETAKKFTEDELRNILAAFSDSEKYGMIIRAKGMLPAKDGGWLHFDYVPDEYEVRKGTPDVTGRLCVIGTDINKEEIEALFKKLN